jgi:disulfide bond formation protein DsbB
MSYLLRFHLLTSIMAASACALGIALIAQYGYQLNPCELCSYQRIPYGSILLFGGLALAFGGWNRAAIGYLFGAIFLVGAALAFYHTGVEQHWWQSATSCGGHQAMPRSLAELKVGLTQSMPKACDNIDWTLFGLSMSVYNTVASLVLSTVCILSARLKDYGVK